MGQNFQLKKIDIFKIIFIFLIFLVLWVKSHDHNNLKFKFAITIHRNNLVTRILGEVNICNINSIFYMSMVLRVSFK